MFQFYFYYVILRDDKKTNIQSWLVVFVLPGVSICKSPDRVERRQVVGWIDSRDRIPLLREHSKPETASVAPDTFIPYNSISVSPSAHAKSNLPVVSWPARSRACVRAKIQRESGFSQFSKFKEMILPILSPESETALPRFISSSICGLISASPPLSDSRARSMIEFSGEAQKLRRTNRKPRACPQTRDGPAKVWQLESKLSLKII